MHTSATLVAALAGGIVLGIAGCSSSAPEPAEATEPAPTPAPDPLNEARIRQQLFEELRSVTLQNCTLKRYGGSNDGGYLMCANLASGVQAAYSYGIATEDAWGCEVSKEFGIEVHQYDCFTEHRPACAGGTFVFHDECVGSKRETVEGRLFDTIPSQMARNGHAGKPVLMKIDVEGAEWDSLMATPDDVLDTFVQMPMELHGVNEARFLELVRRLKGRFHLVNLHFNNFACDPAAAPLPAWAFQVLWVHKSVGRVDADGPFPAPLSPLNAPDEPTLPDCQLP